MGKEGHIPPISIIHIPIKIYKVHLKVYLNAMILVVKEYLQMTFFPFLESKLLSLLRHTCSAKRQERTHSFYQYHPHSNKDVQGSSKGLLECYDAGK